jgi:hypothetical protein
MEENGATVGARKSLKTGKRGVREVETACTAENPGRAHVFATPRTTTSCSLRAWQQVFIAYPPRAGRRRLCSSQRRERAWMSSVIRHFCRMAGTSCTTTSAGRRERGRRCSPASTWADRPGTSPKSRSIYRHWPAWSIGRDIPPCRRLDRPVRGPAAQWKESPLTGTLPHLRQRQSTERVRSLKLVNRSMHCRSALMIWLCLVGSQQC